MSDEQTEKLNTSSATPVKPQSAEKTDSTDKQSIGGEVVVPKRESAEGQGEVVSAEVSAKGTKSATKKAPAQNVNPLQQAEGVTLRGRSALDDLTSSRSLDLGLRERAAAKVEPPREEVKLTEKQLRDIEKAKKKKARKRIDFRFRCVLDENDRVVFVDAYQILNDVFLGKLNVMNYFFIAENSQRINELNFVALDELAAYRAKVFERHGVDCTYCLPLTTRFLDDNAELFEKLIQHIESNGWTKEHIMFSFNASTLENIGPELADPWLKKLRKMGYRVVIDGYGEEYNSLDLFADFSFDYLRLSALYFDKTPPRANMLSALIKLAKANKFEPVMTDVRTKSQIARYKKLGVKLMSGKAVSRMSRFVTRRFLHLTAGETMAGIASVKKAKKGKKAETQAQESASKTKTK